MVDGLGISEMETDWRRRIGLVVVGVVVLITTYALIYQWAMLAFADQQVSLIHSFRIVIEVLTTAGFGGDTAAWEAHDGLGLLVILMNLSGVLFVFLAIPLFAVPMFREAMDRTPPTETDLVDHVIICGHSAMDDVLRAELLSAQIPYLFVENDLEEADRLRQAGENVIYGNVERTQTLRNANAEYARALVADLDNETNPTVILSADRVNPNLNIVSVVHTREAVPYHTYAGADEVVVSKESLGEGLAIRSMKTVSERFQEVVGVATGVQFSEYIIPEGSELIGQTIEECDVFGRDGITIIGGWFGAKFLISPRPETVIQENSILFVSGDHEQLEEMGARQLPSHQGHPDHVIVAGYGDVGRAAVRSIRSESIRTTIIDERSLPDADVVGDVTSRRVLKEAGIEDARSIIIAVNNDVTTIYATILIKNMCPDIEVIARANEDENVWKLYQAGADYVLSLPTVTGEILASTLIEGESILTPHDEFEFVRTETPALVGQTLAESGIRNRTGCTIVGIERGGELITNIGPEVTIENGDVLIGAGGETAIEKFQKLAGTAPEQ